MVCSYFVTSHKVGFELSSFKEGYSYITDCKLFILSWHADIKGALLKYIAIT